MALRLGEHEIWDATARGIAPRARMTPLTFGDEHRVYGKEGRSSRYRSSETPWAVKIFWALSEDSPYQRIVAPKGTQLGFTEIGLIWVGQGIVEGQSALVIQPTDSIAKKVVKTKFRPMLASTTILNGIFAGRSADSTLHFSSPAVDVMFAGSNSPTNFATVTVPRVFGDEVDRWDADLLKEGDPLDLLANRNADYGFLGKTFLPCSPTVEGGLIDREYQQSNKGIFECPCPKCGTLQQWLWENIVGVAKQPETVGLRCVHCAEVSSERDWKAIWGKGDWRFTCPEPVRQDTIGFHLSALYGRYGGRTWGELLQRYEAVVASGQESRMRTFWNTILALPWKIAEDAIPVDHLRSRLEPDHERGLVPPGGLLLTCAVDYQKNRAEADVYAWNRLRERWLVDVVVVPRLTAEGKKRPAADVRRDLEDQVFDKVWPHALGGGLTIEMTVHDANDQPADVFDIIDGLPSKRHVAKHSDEGWGRVNRFEPPKIVDVRRDGKIVKAGRKLMRIHSAEAKRDFYDDLQRPLAESGPSERYVHLPSWIDEESGLLEQFVAEEIRKSTRGKPQWVKTGARNERLDNAVMAMAAHWQLKAHRWNAAEWSRREARVTTDRPAAAAAESPKPDGPPRRSRIRGRMS